MKVTLAQLQVFVALCEKLHFTRAAEHLAISQPSVSKEIRALERTLGLTLLTRSSAGTVLTQEGERLEAQARSVIAAAVAFEVQAAVVKRQYKREVTIAASPSIVNRILPETLRHVDDHELGITLVVLEVETGEVVDAVDSGHADIGLGHQLSEPARSIRRLLGWDELRVVINQSLVPENGGSIDVRRLATVPLLLWPRERSPSYFDAMMDACRTRGLEPLLLTGTSRISGSWSYFLDDARAFSLAPQDFATHEARGDLVSVSMEPPAHVSLDVVWREGNPDVNAVLEAIWSLTQDRRRGPSRTPPKGV